MLTYGVTTNGSKFPTNGSVLLLTDEKKYGINYIKYLNCYNDSVKVYCKESLNALPTFRYLRRIISRYLFLRSFIKKRS